MSTKKRIVLRFVPQNRPKTKAYFIHQPPDKNYGSFFFSSASSICQPAIGAASQSEYIAEEPSEEARCHQHSFVALSPFIESDIALPRPTQIHLSTQCGGEAKGSYGRNRFRPRDQTLCHRTKPPMISDPLTALVT